MEYNQLKIDSENNKEETVVLLKEIVASFINSLGRMPYSKSDNEALLTFLQKNNIAIKRQSNMGMLGVTPDEIDINFKK